MAFSRSRINWSIESIIIQKSEVIARYEGNEHIGDPPKILFKSRNELKRVNIGREELPTKEELVASLEKMVGNIELPANKKRFANFSKTLQFDFTDNSDAICYIIFHEGMATIVDGVNENADLMITTTTEVIMDIMNGTQSPTRAFMSGKIKVKGPMNDLMKLQALMK